MSLVSLTALQIPTSVRGVIRSMVKAHGAWPAYLTEKGIISADAKNADLLEFAQRHPALADEIRNILAGQGAVANDATSNSPSKPLEGPATGPEGGALSTPENSSFPPVGPFVGVENSAEKSTGYDVSEILSGVDQFLSPLVKRELEQALGPVVLAANKPAKIVTNEVERVVEVERIVEVGPGEAPRRVVAKARRDKRVTFRSLFPSRARDAWRDNLVTLWTGAPAPAADPFYVANHHQIAMTMTAFERGANVWYAGPAGTGKSTMPEQVAAYLGRPFVKIGMTRQTDVADLIGGPGLHGGNTAWEDGALVAAMRQPGTIILIDELTIAPAGVQAIFHQVCDDHRSITLPTGEVVKCADGVVFCVADNTTGSGDESGLYAGTNISNAALVTRFKRMIIVDYLTPSQEAEALANHTACPLDAARHLADFVANARRLPALAGVVLSIRQMVGFIQIVQDGFKARDAFAAAISSRMPATERAAIDALADLTWSNAFEALLAGKAAPAAPSDSQASKAFADEQY